MGLEHFTKCGFYSLDDQSHVLKEEKSESVKSASENVDKVGKDNSKMKEGSFTTKPVIIQRKKQIQSGINDKVVSDLVMTKDSPIKREYRVNNKFIRSSTESSKREGKIALVNFIRDNIRAKKVAKVINESVGEVTNEVKGL